MSKKKRQVGRPKEKNSIETTEVLTIALRSFAQLGYGGVSINSLAKKTGVADSLLHYHFGTKEELWKKSMMQAGSQIINSLEDIFNVLDNISGIEKLRIYIKKIVLFSASHPEFQQVVVQEVFSDSSRSNWLIEEVLKPVFAYMEDIVKEEQDKGTIKVIPPANLFSFIIGSIITFFARSYQMKKLYDVDCFDDDQVQNQVTIITDLIMDGLQTKKKAQ
ncbi:MAG: TetR/AcrR family transcriptional regulator [Saprospiraceae bacterium]|nr:TetR/AcrR family transcriptional regulator [Saprospiraceae bacterium]|tara:strand:+ start:558 stop:1214 length:657 start_codon:yes stop_codon:yes gene_type:complete